jgi:hypothetical protein
MPTQCYCRTNIRITQCFRSDSNRQSRCIICWMQLYVWYFFPLGVTVIGCNASDYAANTASCIFKVNNTESTYPNNTESTYPNITCPANMNITPPALVKNTNVFYPPATAVDFGGLPSSPSCLAINGSSFQITPATSPNTVTCQVTNYAGHKSTCTFTILVVDTIPPSITCPSNYSVTPNTNMTASVTLSYAAIATDNQVVSTNTCNPRLLTLSPLAFLLLRVQRLTRLD